MPHATIYTVIAQSIALLFAAAGALQLTPVRRRLRPACL